MQFAKNKKEKSVFWEYHGSVSYMWKKAYSLYICVCVCVWLSLSQRMLFRLAADHDGSMIVFS